MKRIFTILTLFVATTAMAQRTMTCADGVGKIPYFTCPSVGAMRFPVIIVTYQDVGLSDAEENVIRHFDDFFNKEGYDWDGATGSVRDYFICASAGKFAPQFDVLGVVQLEHDRAYYGDGVGTDAGHPDEMVIEGVKALRGKVDFAVYDSNSDGSVDNVIVVYAGNAERFDAPDSAVLPTSYLIQFNKYGVDGFEYGYEQDGLYFDSYTVTSELAYSKYDGIGTFLHEFSHALGLADEYNVYAPNATYTPMKYDLMDVGMYNNSSRTPPTYSAFERYVMGWLELEVIDGPCDICLEPIDKSNKGYIIPVSGNEFFVIENRQKQGWDKYLPGHGLLVWHIDYDYEAWYNNLANYVKAHQRIKLIKPKGTTLTLTPWSGEDLHLPITDIVERDGRITAKVDGGAGVVAPSVSQAADKADTVYDLSGRKAAAASPGVYIVKTATSRQKVALRN